MRGSSISARTMWAVIAAAAVVLLCIGLAQTLYIGTVTNAFERDQIGNTLVLPGAALGMAASGWSRYRETPCGSPSWWHALP